MKNKFRIWSKTINNWVTDLFVENLCNPEKDELNDIFNNEVLVFQQWTGLKDKNGREIYEGDILYWTASTMMKNNTPIIYSDNYKAIVEYSPPIFILRETTNTTPVFWDGAEIIGNIFENPELIKQ